MMNGPGAIAAFFNSIERLLSEAEARELAGAGDVNVLNKEVVNGVGETPPAAKKPKKVKSQSTGPIGTNVGSVPGDDGAAPLP
jgi:hypothetical protein